MSSLYSNDPLDTKCLGKVLLWNSTNITKKLLSFIKIPQCNNHFICQYIIWKIPQAKDTHTHTRTHNHLLE